MAGTCTDYDNTATITESGKTAKQSVTVCVGKDLAVTKTAAGTFNRAYLWSIAKAVDVPQINIANGGTATFNYTVTATQTGISDSGWTPAGKITVTNPNDWEAITVDVSDAEDSGGACTVAGGTAFASRGHVPSRRYTCTFATAPAANSGINTATATWDPATGLHPARLGHRSRPSP